MTLNASQIVEKAWNDVSEEQKKEYLRKKIQTLVFETGNIW
jgi:hypothetical protein